MTKTDLLNKILELGKRLENTNGFAAEMLINDMKIEVDNYVEQLPVPDNVAKKVVLVCNDCGGKQFVYSKKQNREICLNCWEDSNE